MPIALLVALALGILAAIDPQTSLLVAVLILAMALILPKPRFGLYFIAALLPFETIGAFGSVFTIVKFIGIITFLAWFISIAKTRRSSLNLGDKTSLLLLLFVAMSALSVTQTINLPTSAVGFLTLLQLVGLYFMTMDLASDEQIFNQVLRILVLAGIPAALITLAQFFMSGASRALGVYPDPNYSALNMLILLPLSLIFINRNQNNKRQLWYFGVFMLLFFGIFATLSRGGLIALLFILLLGSLNNLLAPRIKHFLRISVVTMFFIVVLLALGDSRFSPSAIVQAGGSGRLDIWKTAWQVFLDHPLIGVGIHTYKLIHPRYAAQLANVKPWLVVPVVTHNTFIEVAVETGLFGLAFFLAFVSSILIRISRLKQRLIENHDFDRAVNVTMLVLSLGAFLVSAIFLNTLMKKTLWLLLGLLASQSVRADGLSVFGQFRRGNHE